MEELIAQLPESTDVKYLLDTCFFVWLFQKNKAKQLISFCQKNKVGMSRFNLSEFVNMHHTLHGTANHHIRNFLKLKILYRVPIDIRLGEKEKEREYVEQFDERILKLVTDPSDAILLVLALRLKADILTRDKHHLFTTIAENYSNEWHTKILNDFA